MMKHKTIVIQCTNDKDADNILNAIAMSKHRRAVSYQLDDDGQKAIEEALPSLSNDFDFLGVTDDEI